MKDSFEIKIDTDGIIRTVHQEGIESFAKEIGGEISTSCRASDVEWEDFGSNKKGWTVRSAYNNKLALRHSADKEVLCNENEELSVVVFETREEAIKWELKFFWELLAAKDRK